MNPGQMYFVLTVVHCIAYIVGVSIWGHSKQADRIFLVVGVLLFVGFGTAALLGVGGPY
jgi:hypothetical protein